MRKKLFPLFVSIFAVFSCKASYSSEELANPDGNPGKFEVFSTPKQTMIYSWTNDPAALGSPKNARAYIEKIVKTAQGNRDLGGVGGDNEMGYGFYTAADPVNSKEYGRILVEVPLLANSSLGVGNQNRMNSLPIIRNIDAFPAIIYNFGGLEFSGGGRAIVLRSTKLLDLSAARSYDCRSGDLFFANHKALKITNSTTSSEILNLWCDQMHFIWRVASSTELRNADHTISDYAVVEAIYSEIYATGAKVKQMMALTKGAEGKRRFPKLTESLESHLNGRFDDETYKFQIYLEGLVRSLFETIPVKQGASREPVYGDAPQLNEMIEFFKYLGRISPNGEPGSVAELTKTLVNQWKSLPGATERLEEAIDAVSLLKKRMSSDGFNAWDIPGLKIER